MLGIAVLSPIYRAVRCPLRLRAHAQHDPLGYACVGGLESGCYAYGHVLLKIVHKCCLQVRIYSTIR
jgi:hypothetical protein